MGSRTYSLFTDGEPPPGWVGEYNHGVRRPGGPSEWTGRAKEVIEQVSRLPLGDVLVVETTELPQGVHPDDAPQFRTAKGRRDALQTAVRRLGHQDIQVSHRQMWNAMHTAVSSQITAYTGTRR